MQTTKPRIRLFALFALAFALLVFGCTQAPATPRTGASSPWAPDTNQSPSQPSNPIPVVANSSSIESTNQPVPYNFSALGAMNSTGNAAGNETAAGQEGNSTQPGFFDMLAMNSTVNITLSEFSRHSTASSCWTAIHGDVFDMTGLVGKYPLGASKILNLCALDGTYFYENEFSREMENSTSILGPLFKGTYAG
ncbi:MAG: cytochrome b5-like heme/steroid binding domain-containing protein [Candidatus Micrarchaeia archaeon]